MVLALLVAVVPVLGVRTAAAATTVTITLRINHVLQIENPDSAAGDGDYFPEIRIGDGPLERRGEIEDDDFSPGWTFTHTQTLADGESSVPILIRLWDGDSGPTEGGDDKMDISPLDHDVDLDLFFFNTVECGSWAGDVLNSATVAQGDGDHGFPRNNDGRKARIDFSLSTCGNGDLDLDGIPDVVERQGSVSAPDGSKVADLVGLDPCRKSVIVQIDWMADGTHSHEPSPSAIGEVVSAFDHAPVDAVVPCPYPGAHKATGMDFVYVRGKQITEQPVMNFDDDDYAEDFRDWRDADFNFSLAIYAHYAIFAHDLNAGDSSSGQCCEPERGHNKDFLVTLGSWDNRIGTTRDQSGSIMHELGHALGLGHGGGDDTNYKPNYLSVMNYAFDPDGIPTGPSPAPARLDYSGQRLPKLTKSKLLEPAGIGDGTDMTTWTSPDGMARFERGNVAINWNWNLSVKNKPIIETVPVSVDVNPGDDATTDRDELTGFDDWHSIQFRAAAAQTAGGVGVNHGPDIDYETVQERRAAFHDFYDPDVTAAKTVDKADAQAGDKLGYSVTVKNVGKGMASSVSLTDTFPDATTDVRAIDNLNPDQSATEAFSYLVPCTTEDGTKLTNKATVTATNLDGGAEVNTANNTGTAITTVHAPRLTLTKQVTPKVNAGEAITTTLTVTNTGSAPATNITLTDTIPAEVYYSTALDLGSGPKPTTVTGNPSGTTTLTWKLGPVAGGGTQSVQFTDRPSLLFTAGAKLADTATVTYENGNGCTYKPVSASGETSVTEVPATRDPLSAGYWKTHPEARTAEFLARVQATDQRFDGEGGGAKDGALSNPEATTVLSAGGRQPEPLRRQLIAVLFDLASRRVNASTPISSPLARSLGVTTVGQAVRYAFATLTMPVSGTTASRYSDATTLLDQIANGKSI
ncbi:DUF11 domain-containing protein [Streptosporangiaceae bacterium NEAU-GS5]|nr:DUF11 domain-containing protein [Streptosporangiaceae bacterium NEAU-GS5]